MESIEHGLSARSVSAEQMLILRQYTPFSGERAVGRGKNVCFRRLSPFGSASWKPMGDGLLLIMLGLLSLAGIGEADFQ